MSTEITTSKKKLCAIAQSNYIPWKGYFDLINIVDEYIIFDSVQYTRRDFRNRQLIQTPQGLKWLSIPVQTKGNYFASIDQMKVCNSSWAENHWKTLEHSYKRAPHFKAFEGPIKSTYERASKETYLSQINFLFLQTFCSLLDIKTKLSFDRDYQIEDGKSYRLLSLCRQINASDYYSGPAARSYLEVELFTQANIGVHWMNYDNYPMYKQFHQSFAHEISILDLLFCCGPTATDYMKTFSKKTAIESTVK